MTLSQGVAVARLPTKQEFEKHVTLYIGGVHATDEGIVIKTLLGSCIAVCLHDPLAKVGGMNHFLLPHGLTDETHGDPTRFGVHAMDRLLAAIMKVGGDRRRLVAKVFGGAQILDDSRNEIPRKNIAFAEEFLTTEGFPVAGWDVGGTHPREVLFEPRTGRVLVRRVTSDRLRTRTLRQEQAKADKAAFGAVSWFVQE
jgi:chemotaxis receptor (MCP) glutamine deamidase CheD